MRLPKAIALVWRYSLDLPLKTDPVIMSIDGLGKVTDGQENLYAGIDPQPAEGSRGYHNYPNPTLNALREHWYRGEWPNLKTLDTMDIKGKYEPGPHRAFWWRPFVKISTQFHYVENWGEFLVVGPIQNKRNIWQRVDSQLELLFELLYDSFR